MMTRGTNVKTYLFDFCLVSVGTMYKAHLEVVVSVTYLSPKKINYRLGFLRNCTLYLTGGWIFDISITSFKILVKKIIYIAFFFLSNFIS